MAKKKKPPSSKQKNPWVSGPCANCGERAVRKQSAPPVCGRCLGAALRLIKQEFPQQFRNAQKLFAVTTGVFRLWYPQPEGEYVQ
jgi:hypothetical protein